MTVSTRLAVLLAAAVCLIAAPRGWAQVRTVAQVNVTWWDPAAGMSGGFVSNGYSLILYDDLVPTTVSNFLSYAWSGEYQFNIVDATAALPGETDPGFLSSGGWWVANAPGGGLSPQTVSGGAPIASELLANPGLPLSNVRGTISAFNPTGGDITSHWLVNLMDNNNGSDPTSADDFDEYGFTPFGEVLTPDRNLFYTTDSGSSFQTYTTAAGGMDLVDGISDLDTFNFDGTFTPDPENVPSDFPLVPVLNYDQTDYDAGTPLALQNLVFTSVIPVGLTFAKQDVDFSGQQNFDDIVSLDSLLADPESGYLWQADVNDDALVTSADRWVLFDALGATGGDVSRDGLFTYDDRAPLLAITGDLEPYSAFADMDRNGVINSTDVALFDQQLAQYRAVGDVNGDGQVSDDDITPFLVAWAMRHEAEPDLFADLTGNSLVDTADYDAFFALLGSHVGELGDMNRDGVVGLDDINPFNLVAFDGEPYDFKADFNLDGVLDASDASAFAALFDGLVGSSDGPPLAGEGGGGTIPEPGSLGMLAAGLAMLTRRRRGQAGTQGSSAARWPSRPRWLSRPSRTTGARQPGLAMVVAVFLMMLTAPAAFAGVGREVVHVDFVTYSPAHEGYISSRLDVMLYNDLAPNTVANFKQYIAAGLYDWTIVHRNAKNNEGAPFVIQGGGFTVGEDEFDNRVLEPIVDFGTIDSEFDAETMSNVRGTLAMARLGNNENSADSQWFINMADNTFLDYANVPSVVGFTVFAEVINANTTGGTSPVNSGMTLADAIASVPNFDFDGWASAAGELPLVNFTNTEYAAALAAPGGPTPPDYENFVWVTMSMAADVLIGDINGDSLVNTEDINPFIAALLTPGLSYNINADINQDGLINTEDINPFISLLTATAPAGAGTTIPEPASTLVLLSGMVGLLRRRRLKA